MWNEEEIRFAVALAIVQNEEVSFSDNPSETNPLNTKEKEDILNEFPLLKENQLPNYFKNLMKQGKFLFILQNSNK